ncbi:MAG: hypothetical protein FJ146_05565 [Deltaproteobacteria bacterium]|nr:hypothetical protein [Deltaproteobacteria bacterium]
MHRGIDSPMWLPPIRLSNLYMSEIAALWPAELPLVCLGRGGRFLTVATHFREVPWAEFAALEIRSPRQDSGPMHSGYIGVLSYDQFADLPHDVAGAPPRVVRVESALVYDRVEGKLYVPRQSEARQPGDVWVDAAALSERLVQSCSVMPHFCDALQLTPAISDDAYESLVDRVIEDIRAGRYYQLNLLRFFDLRERLQRRELVARMDLCGGVMSGYLELPGLTLMSLSPERFVTVQAGNGAPEIVTYPIKGTAPRHDGDPLADQKAALHLTASTKDRAELAMIVDLMRNDLQQVCRLGSVKVDEHAALISACGVHHLQAKIRGALATPLNWGALLQKLCPAGSITGAPKREVMAAIRQFEGRARGYFMGHMFSLSDDGAWDSSVLIRTFVGRGDGQFAYAAGSGLVIGSDPVSERLEIAAKCRAATQHAVMEEYKNMASDAGGFTYGFQENL